MSNLQINTWYVLRIVVDDSGCGFYVEAYQESNPSVRGAFTQWMPTGKSWRFHHWIWRGNAYLDDYREFSTSGLIWTPDERVLFTYDHLDRLVSASPESGAQGYSQSFEYNAVGNITSFAGTAYAYNDAAHKHAVTHLGGVQKYWYDANGSMTTRVENGVTYQQAWDSESRLTSVTGNGTTTFTYDGDGARVKKVDSSGTTVYVGAVEVLINATQRITRTYYSAGAQLVAMRVVTSTGGNALYYLHSDHLGSTSLTTNSSGGVVGELKYYPYGVTRYTSGNTPTQRRFTGQISEEANLGSLYFFNARFYSPAIGRFVSADTIVPEPGNPQSLNRFGYVHNNPLKYIDPSGHRECSDADIECGEGGSPVFLDLRKIGIRPGTDVDPLVSEFYKHPDWFDVTASVEFANTLNQTAAWGVGIFVGQGLIPDRVGEHEHYPARSTITYNADGAHRWLREVLVDGEYKVVFDATWEIKMHEGRPMAKEKFNIPHFFNDDAIVYLEAEVSGRSLTWRSTNILISPNADHTQYIDAVKFGRALGVQVSIVFETRQTGPNTIQSVGELYFNEERQGQIIFDGIYRP